MPDNLQKQREEFAENFLMEAVRFLKSQEPTKRNWGGMTVAGTAAKHLPKRGVYRKLRAIWNQTPKDGFNSGYEGKKFHEFTGSPAGYNRLISRKEFPTYLRTMQPNPLDLCLETSTTLEIFLETKRSPLEIQEFGLTYAVLGSYDKALDVASCSELDGYRQGHIREVIEMEKLRDGDFKDPDLKALGMGDAGVDPWIAGHVALCALGRLPYMGYPYPDW